jgi:amidase
VDPLGQSCCGSGALDAAAGGALADEADADGAVWAAALAEGDGAGGPLSLEHPKVRNRAAVTSSLRIRRILNAPSSRRSENVAMDDPCELSARALAERLRRRELSSVEALEAHLARIERFNPALNAVVSLDVEGARNAAKAADVALQRGQPVGPLHGVPMTLKDGHDVAGLRTTLGAPTLDRMATEDGTVASRLRAAGAIIVGHTNVPPWLGDYQSNNPIFGRTNNPWNTDRTAGGSSGGAAAAVAAGMTPLEVGSDLAGSLRLPAHFCGVYALKTTEHRVPLTGFFRLPFDTPRSVRIMSTLGPIARDLGDLELALSIVLGPDSYDSDVPPVPLATVGRRALADLSLAASAVPPHATLAKSVRRQVERVAEEAKAAGARVTERLPDVEWSDLHALFADLVTTITGIFSPESRLRDEQRALAWYLAALDRRDRFISLWEKYFEGVDALVLPAAITNAFAHCETGAPIPVDGQPVSYWEIAHPMVLGSLTGLPSLAVPAGFDEDGLPVGVQIVGPRWSETRLLEIARQLEQEGILPGFRAPPRSPPSSCATSSSSEASRKRTP